MKYQDVVLKLRSEIQKGRYAVGTRVPSVRWLSAKFKLSPNTIVKSLSILRQMGMIAVKPGIGYVVISQTPHVKKIRLNSKGNSDYALSLLCSYIQSKKFVPGDTIHSIRKIADELGLSTTTIVKAETKLQEAGYLLAQRHVGVQLIKKLPIKNKKRNTSVAIRNCRKGSLSKFQEVAQKLIAEIQTGQYAAGELLPSIRCLSAKYKLSEKTIIKSLALLSQKRIIAIKSGFGYVVASQKPRGKS